MSLSTRNHQRIRARNGQFVSSGSSTRTAESLANQRARQKAYVSRRRRMSKRLTSSFARNVIIRGEGKLHWLPACIEDGIVFVFIESLFKETYLESRRTRLSVLKTIYFQGDPRNSKKHLPRLTIRDADLQESAINTSGERVPAFVGWRFPFVIDPYEMDNVKKWLREHEKMLRVSLKDAMSICCGTFNRYVKCSNKYFYSGYPIPSNSPSSARASEPGIPVAQSSKVSNRCGSPPEESEQDCPAEGYIELTQSSFELRAARIMSAAKNDEVYRELSLALNPKGKVEYSVLCQVWASTFHSKEPPEGWCMLQKDLLVFCKLQTTGQTETEQYGRMRQFLSDQLEVLKLVRKSANLPLYEGEDWI